MNLTHQLNPQSPFSVMFDSEWYACELVCLFALFNSTFACTHLQCPCGGTSTRSTLSPRKMTASTTSSRSANTWSPALDSPIIYAISWKSSVLNVVARSSIAPSQTARLSSLHARPGNWKSSNTWWRCATPISSSRVSTRCPSMTGMHDFSKWNNIEYVI